MGLCPKTTIIYEGEKIPNFFSFQKLVQLDCSYSPTPVIRTSIIRTWSLFKKMVFSLKSQALRLSRVHVFVCHTYMFNVIAQWYVIVYSVKCKGRQTRPYIFLCYIIVCI